MTEKELLYPAFGSADVANQTVYVRADLPDPVKRFVQAHEEYHRPRIDIFARRKRYGFDAFGNEMEGEAQSLS